MIWSTIALAYCLVGVKVAFGTWGVIHESERWRDGSPALKAGQVVSGFLFWLPVMIYCLIRESKETAQ